jgi:predicted nucleic acid-binding protein
VIGWFRGKRLEGAAVLVPVFLTDHPHHHASLDLFLQLDKRRSWCAAHSLAELYSSLARMPGKHRVSCEHAILFVAEARERLGLVALDEEEYYLVIKKASLRGTAGGTIYDALVAACAHKVKVETIYTWNLRHFQQLDFAGRIKTP